MEEKQPRKNLENEGSRVNRSSKHPETQRILDYLKKRKYNPEPQAYRKQEGESKERRCEG